MVLSGPPPLPKEKCFEKLRESKVILSNGIDQCQARQPQGLASDQGSAFAEPWPSVITGFGKTYSPPEGTVFRQDSSKRESKQQVSTLSRNSSPSERTVFERPTLKEGSFPAFKALFRKYGSVLPAAIRRPQGGYYHKGSITEHAFRTAYKQFCKRRQLGMGNDSSQELGSRKSGGAI